MYYGILLRLDDQVEYIKANNLFSFANEHIAVIMKYVWELSERLVPGATHVDKVRLCRDSNGVKILVQESSKVPVLL